MDKKTQCVVNELLEHIYNLRKDFTDLVFSYNDLQRRVLKIENPALAEELEPQIHQRNMDVAKTADKYDSEFAELQQRIKDDL
ncbi:MAG: hypothetical protein ACOZBX_06550 [Campylobacterota bacterium]